MQKEYRLYIDEAGDHTACKESDDVGKRYLALMGVIMDRGEVEAEKFRNELESFKRRHLAYDVEDPPILHREDILNCRGAFGVLRDQNKKRAFDVDLLSVMQRAQFRAICVVLDKHTHWGLKSSPWRIEHPYHYCLMLMLERYCGWLGHVAARGDVMVEARGNREDTAFREAYAKIYEEGGRFLPKVLAQSTLTSKNPKVKGKDLNIAGLQLSDLLAHPLKRDVLFAYNVLPSRGSAFADRVAEVVFPKYNRRSHDRRVKGYGQVIVQ